MLYVLMRSRTNYIWLIQAIHSVLCQQDSEFKILFVDDASDYTREQKTTIQRLLKNHIVTFNNERKYSLRNAYEMIREYAKEDGIVVNVDGDDFLAGSDVLSRIKYCYQKSNCLLAYGECRVLQPSWNWKELFPSKYIFSKHNTRYSKETEVNNTYRKDPVFRPLHPRSWKVSLFNKIDVTDFLDDRGNWFKTCEDQAMFFPMLEMAGGRYCVENRVLYYYRYNHPEADSRVNRQLQLSEEAFIRKKSLYNRIYD